MDKYQKFGQISGQVFIGIGFGIGSAILSLIIAGLYNDRLELLEMAIYALIGFYIGNPIGIGYDRIQIVKEARKTKGLLQILYSKYNWDAPWDCTIVLWPYDFRTEYLAWTGDPCTGELINYGIAIGWSNYRFQL